MCLYILLQLPTTAKSPKLYIIVRGERKLAGEKDVKDDPKRPSIIAVGWSGATKRLRRPVQECPS